MATGYEVQQYNNVARIAKALETAASALQRLAIATERVVEALLDPPKEEVPDRDLDGLRRALATNSSQD